MIHKSQGLFIWLMATCIVLSPGASMFGEEKKEQSDNEKWTQEAWKAYNDNNFDSAIKEASQCITEFRRTADDTQKELKDKNEPLPPVGNVDDSKKRDEIFNRGPLNDVATCYFIQGESYAKLAEGIEGAAKKEKLAKAKSAYEKAAKYTYARTWDPKGWFWDPAKKANERLEDMEPVRP